MIELPEDFRDLLLALHDAGAAFVVLGGHAVAFHGHPVADGQSFELEGRRIPLIGKTAPLPLRNKRAAGRAQDLAGVKALERIK